MSDIEEVGSYDLDIDLTEDQTPDWRPKVLVIGAVVGALVGLGAAYLLVQNVEDESRPPEITAGKGLKLGLLLLGLVRSVADLA